jgi:hypothetical protein
MTPMSMAVAPHRVTLLNRAVNASALGHKAFVDQLVLATTDPMIWANAFAAQLERLSAADLAQRVLGNLGLLPNPQLGVKRQEVVPT